MKFTKLLVLGALLLSGSIVAEAEIKDGVRVQPKPAKTQGFVASETTDTYYYLYNVNGQRFFTEGNAWGTQASVGFTGLKVAFTADAEYPKAYLFNDYSLAKKSWKLVFFDSKTAMYVDRGSQANYRWAVVAGDGTFRLQAASADNGNPGWTSNGETDPAFEEGKFVGWDASSNSTILNPYLAEGENHCVDWAFVLPEDYDAIAPALELYAAALPLKELLDKAKEIGADVAAEEAVYLNEASTVEEINAAIKSAEEAIAKREQELAQGGYENATVDNPVDVTSLFIKNPTFEGNKYDGWSGDAFGGYNPKNNAEHYNKTYNTWQQLSELKEGVYRVNVHAFYRAGDAGPAYTNYKANNEASKYAKIFAVSGNDSIVNSIASPYTAGLTAALAGGSWSTATDAETSTTYHIPNNMEAADVFFSAGYCNDNSVLIIVSDGQLKIGVRKDNVVSGDWSIFDDFSLTYYGNGDDAYVMAAKSIAATLPDYSELGEAVYTQSYLDAYNTAKAALAAATSKDDIKAAVAAAQESAAALELNIELWLKYQELVAKALSVAANDSYNIIYREELGDYEMDLDYNLGARSMTNEQLQALCDEIEAAIDRAIHAPLAGADMTDLLKNPGFDEGGQNNFPGWTATWKNAGAARVVASCAEFWNTESFDMYQELTELPKGVYEVSVQGFYRYLRGANAWSAYLNKDPNTLAENIPTYIYMNDNQTPFTNVFGDPRREELQLSPDGTSAPAIYTATDYVSLTDDNTGNTYFFPDNMQSSADCFGQGMYTQKAYGLVAEDGDKLRLGVIGSSSQGGDSWVIFDNFRLTYKGMDAEIIKPVLETNIAKAEASLQGYIGKSVRAALEAAVEEAKAALDKDGQTMFNALSALFATTRAVNESKAKFNELVAANESLAQAANDAFDCSIETLQQARLLNMEISDNLEAGVYEDEDVDALLEQIANMIKELAKPEGFSEATDENGKSANWCIVNPSYAQNTNEGWTSTANASVNYNICEVFNNDFNYYQDVDLPAGTYELTAPGFYRYGSAAEDYTAFKGDASLNNNLVMYVTVGADSMAVAMPRLASAAEEYTVDVNVAEDGTKSFDAKAGYIWVDTPVANADSTQATGIIVVNNMEQAANKFAEGFYGGTTITFKVPEDMTVRIGMSKAVQQSNNWCIWGAWNLTYFGKNSSKTVTPAGITAAQSNGQVARIEFFNLNGARINTPQRGVVIVKRTMADGTVKVQKVVVK